MNDSKLCMRCFEPVQDPLVCEACEWHGETSRERDGELPPGSLLRERYYVGRVLGRGGFGITYLGWDARLRRKRAIKEYFPRGVATRSKDATRMSVISGQNEALSDGIEKFLTEAQLLARFENHPCIVSPRDFFEENGTAYLVMECLVGETLAHHLQRNEGKIGYGRAFQYLEPVMQALSTLHAAGILHRDVSPENIFLTVEQQPKLLDFGAARQRVPAHGELTVILRENYAPPEQYTKAGRQGPWTDVYALGATLYRSITGQHPPRSVDRLMADTLQPPSALGVALPARCERALMAAMALRHGDRPDIDTLLASLKVEPEHDAVRKPREPSALRLAVADAAALAHSALARTGQRVAAGLAWLRPHVRSSGLLGASIAAAVLALAALWTRAPDILPLHWPTPATPVRTAEEIESHAAQPKQAQPQAAEAVVPPAASEFSDPAGSPAAAAPPNTDLGPGADVQRAAEMQPDTTPEPLELAPAGEDVALVTPVETPAADAGSESRTVLEPSGLDLAKEPLARPMETAPAAEPPLVPPSTPSSLAQPPSGDAPALTQASRLIVRTNVNDDIVEIDGSERGPSGPSGFAVEHGRHKVRVRKPGRKTFEIDVEIAAGERKVVQARLDPDKTVVDQLSREGLRMLAGGPEGWPEGIRRLQEAANQGDGQATGTLGELYAYGSLVSGSGARVATDDPSAITFHRKAAEMGDRTAQSRLAYRLEDGRWPARGEANTPQVGASGSSVWSFLTGRRQPTFLESLRGNKREGRPADFAEAFRWHKAAAMRGLADSQKRLGFMYAAGRGVDRNEFTALYWFLESARQGEAEAQYVAGMCYAVGEGYSKNEEAARCWLQRAAAQGHPQAREELERTGFDPEANGGWGNAPKACNFRGP